MSTRSSKPWCWTSGSGLAIAAAFALAACAAGCAGKKDAAQKTVVVYTSQDDIYARPIFDEFQRRSGIRVLMVGDDEADKTTGLIGRLRARKDHPDCDVHWNNEILQTVRLAQDGLLQSYVSPQAERFPKEYRDAQGRWTGLAARLRVILYNTKLVSAPDAPTGLADLTAEKWRGRAVIARPLFGTTLTHMVALDQKWGPRRLGEFLAAIQANGVALAAGNARVRDMVAGGERAFGLTDSDDARGAMLDGKPVAIAIPDADRDGALLMPNTVALIRNCPHPREGKLLIDYLLSAEVERKLAEGRSAQIPLAKDLADVKTPWDSLNFRGRCMTVDLAKAAESIPQVIDLLMRSNMDQ